MERCLVLPREILFGSNDEHQFTGFRRADEWTRDLDALVKEHGEYLPRHPTSFYPGVESHDYYKQIIPIALFLHCDHMFVYKRIGGSEKRIMSPYQLSIGGHVEPEDDVGDGRVLEVGLLREFHEEMCYSDPYTYTHVGYVNADGTMVDRVHFGSVYLIEGGSPHLTVNETDKHVGEMIPISAGKSLDPPLSSWQEYLYDYVLSLRK